jgi:hypothetical protein
MQQTPPRHADYDMFSVSYKADRDEVQILRGITLREEVNDMPDPSQTTTSMTDSVREASKLNAGDNISNESLPGSISGEEPSTTCRSATSVVDLDFDIDVITTASPIEEHRQSACRTDQPEKATSSTPIPDWNIAMLQANRRIIYNLTIILLLFVIMYLSSLVTSVITLIFPTAIPPTVTVVQVVLFILHSGCNSVVWVIKIPEYRAQVINTLCCRKSSEDSRDQEDISNIATISPLAMQPVKPSTYNHKR